MSLVEQQNIFLQHVARLIDKADTLGIVLSGGELYRTIEQQKLHIEAGRSKTLKSQHLKRLAIDLNFFIRESGGKLKLVYDHPLITQLGAFWENLDDANQWGGRWSSFKDTPHFERRITNKTVAKAVTTEGKGVDLLIDTVGFKCQNNADDVELVQRLINLHAQDIGLKKLLVPDGKYGANTQKAMTLFEQEKLGESQADNKISPRDATVTALCKKVPATVDETFLQLLYLRPTSARLKTFVKPIIDCMAKYEINTPLRQMHFLAQIGHESAELCFTEELASGRAYEGRADLGNTESGDGMKFKGRGLIQLTGRANYTSYNPVSGFDVDLLEKPETVSEDLAICVDVAGWFWHSRGLNDLADQDKLMDITKRINGGTNGLEDRRRLYLRAKTLLTD